MLNLRLQGFSMDSLSLVFGCDKKAIRYQLKKYGTIPWEPVVNPFDANKKLMEDKLKGKIEEDSRWKIVDGEKINRGKSYAEYLHDSFPS